VLKFLCVTEAYRPHIQTKYRAIEFKRGYGGCSQRNFAILGVAGSAKQISGPLGNRNLFFAPDTSEMILPALAGVKILIFAGVVERQPPKFDPIFLKILVKYLKRSPRKTGTPRNLVHMLLRREMTSICNAPPC